MFNQRNVVFSLMTGLLVGLLGCTTYGDIADRAPYKIVPMSTSQGAAADCFHAHLIRTIELGITLVRIQEKDGPHVAGQIAGAGSGGFYVFDVAFVAAASGASNAIVRTKMDVWGNPQMPSEAMAALQECSNSH